MAIALPLRFAPVPRKALAILAPVLASFIDPRITPFAPRAAAFFRWDLIIPPSDVPSLEPLEFKTATSVYGFLTLLESVKTCTPSGQTGASLRLGLRRAAFVETHATKTGVSQSIHRRMRRSRIGGCANLRLPGSQPIGWFCGTGRRKWGRPVARSIGGVVRCDRRDSNPHGLPHRILRPARLPVPPRSPACRGCTSLP